MLDKKLPYDKATHLAQDDEPWRRLHNTTTQASSRRNVFHYDTTVSWSLTSKEGLNLLNVTTNVSYLKIDIGNLK